MFDNIKWKTVIIASAAALVLSLTIGGINNVKFIILILRALAFAVIFGGAALGIQILFQRFFPDFNQDVPADQSEPQSQNVDFTMDREDYNLSSFDSETLGPSNGSVKSSEDESLSASEGDSLASADTSSAEETDEPAEEAQAVDDGFDNVDDAEETVAARSKPDDVEVVTSRDKAPVAFDSSTGKMDKLPDLSSFSEDFDSQDAVTAVRSEINSKDTASGRKEWKDGNVEDFLKRNNEPADLARSISTVLKKDQL